MNLYSCVVGRDGQSCSSPVTMTEPVELCDEHKLQVAAAVVPGLLAGALRDARSVASRTLPAEQAHLVASAQSALLPTTDPHTALVYFMANGGRVKIGYTKSLFSRISSLSLREEAVLLLLHGGIDLERALHAKFGAYRVADSEWFELAPDVVHFIAEKAPKHRMTRGARRPTRQKAIKRAAGLSRKEQQVMVREVIAALFDSLGRRPLESEMVAALKTDGLPHSRANANRLRLLVERQRPHLAALGSTNITAITGS